MTMHPLDWITDALAALMAWWQRRAELLEEMEGEFRAGYERQQARRLAGC